MIYFVSLPYFYSDSTLYVLAELSIDKSKTPVTGIPCRFWLIETNFLISNIDFFMTVNTNNVNRNSFIVTYVTGVGGFGKVENCNISTDGIIIVDFQGIEFYFENNNLNITSITIFTYLWLQTSCK
jgi:hypothetical protein